MNRKGESRDNQITAVDQELEVDPLLSGIGLWGRFLLSWNCYRFSNLRAREKTER